MNEKILVPVLGESITEATVAKWLKKEGDTVEADAVSYTHLTLPTTPYV